MVGDEVKFLVSVTNMGCEEWGPEVRMMEVGRSGPVTNTSSIGLCGLRPGEETLVEVKLEAPFLPGFTESTWNIFDGDTSERCKLQITDNHEFKCAVSQQVWAATDILRMGRAGWAGYGGSDATYGNPRKKKRKTWKFLSNVNIELVTVIRTGSDYYS